MLMFLVRESLFLCQLGLRMTDNSQDTVSGAELFHAHLLHDSNKCAICCYWVPIRYVSISFCVPTRTNNRHIFAPQGKVCKLRVSFRDALAPNQYYVLQDIGKWSCCHRLSLDL